MARESLREAYEPVETKAINGAILDAYENNPGVGFSIIFGFMAGVGVVGAVLAFWLHRLNRLSRLSRLSRCVDSDGVTAASGS
ncbi:hypothetical protein [Mobiluncus mulieris]|uniref:hypothetical protein n=1 Tax=Mobiluncus mulieris TaxID=2052 RepID=UPI0024301DF7|nr:hypothetical protein [Mobiluncus mulieris]